MSPLSPSEIRHTDAAPERSISGVHTPPRQSSHVVRPKGHLTPARISRPRRIRIHISASVDRSTRDNTTRPTTARSRDPFPSRDRSGSRGGPGEFNDTCNEIDMARGSARAQSARTQHLSPPPSPPTHTRGSRSEGGVRAGGRTGRTYWQNGGLRWGYGRGLEAAVAGGQGGGTRAAVSERTSERERANEQTRAREREREEDEEVE